MSGGGTTTTPTTYHPLVNGSTLSKQLSGEEIDVTLVLKPDQDLQTTARSMAFQNPANREYHSRESFKERFDSTGPVAEVQRWATNNGLQVIETHRSSNTVKVRGPAARLAQLFGTGNMAEYNLPDGSKYISHVFHHTIPSEIANNVQAVLGLDTRDVARHHLNMHSKLNFTSNYANQIAAAYGFPMASQNGNGICIAVVELGGGFSQNDLANYWAKAGITPIPNVIAMGVDGAQNKPGVDQNADGEVCMDIEIIGSVAPGAKIVVYFSPNTDAGFLDCFNAAIHDNINKPSIISCSWGGPENTWSPTTLQAYDQAFQAASTMGITIFAASGDAGSSDGESGINCDYPASDPYVTGCGGTSLVFSGTSITSETVWTPDSGGGVSSVWPLPLWQQSANVPLNPTTNQKGRGVPDVSGCADPNTGYTIVVDGQVYNGTGGTSAVAPLWSGLIALLNQAFGKPVGFINPIIYTSPSSFNNITVGNNGYWQAKVGYDCCTGLGSPKPALLAKLLAGGATPTGAVTAPNVSVTTNQATPVIITLTATTTNAGASISTYDIPTNPVNGTLAVNAASSTSATITYTPNANFSGIDSFMYQATDSTGAKSNIATATITVKKSTTSPSSSKRYRLQSTTTAGDPVPEGNWKKEFDSGPLSPSSVHDTGINIPVAVA